MIRRWLGRRVAAALAWEEHVDDALAIIDPSVPCSNPRCALCNPNPANPGLRARVAATVNDELAARRKR